MMKFTLEITAVEEERMRERINKMAKSPDGSIAALTARHIEILEEQVCIAMEHLHAIREVAAEGSQSSDLADHALNCMRKARGESKA